MWRTIRCSVLFLALVFAFNPLLHANNKADSLRRIIQTTSSDTLKAKAYNRLSKVFYLLGNSDSALYYAKQCIAFSENALVKKTLSPKEVLSVEKQQASAYRNIGSVYIDRGDFAHALNYDTASLRISQKTGDKKLIAFAYGNLSGVYTCSGNYVDALNYGLKALQFDEESDNKNGMTSAYTNIGNIYTAEKNYAEALKNHEKCLQISKQIGFKRGMTWAYNNMGDIYEQQGKHNKAMEKYKACLAIGKEINYKEVIAASYGNIGSIYSEQGDYTKALKNEIASKKLWVEMGAKQYIASLNVSIGEVYSKQKKYKLAQAYIDTALTISIKSGYKEVTKQAYNDLSNVYASLANTGMSPSTNWKEAYSAYKKYFQYNDSLFNETTRQKSVQAQMQFEFDKKQAAAKAIQDKQNALFTQQKEKEALVVKYLAAGFLLVLALAFFMYRGYRQKQRANVIISKQKDVVEEKNMIIEARNKAITDSINYAKRIQNAMLPPEEEMSKKLSEYFIFYRPKDIVSGDFYFYKQAISSKAKNTFYLAACDCTGHGVPGAFMSMIGNGKLNDAVEQYSNTGEILRLLNKEVKLSLHQSQSDESTRDGMDIALCGIAFAENTGRTVQFSGANRPLWVARQNKEIMEEIKPVKKSIGGFTDADVQFETHTVELEKGDAFYLFTDGLADQFGGPKGKKLTTKKLMEFMKGIKNHAMHEQKLLVKEFIEKWMGTNEQVDDMLIIGVRV